MAQYDYDFFVIGAGSGGVRASRIAAGHGARVGIAEDRYLGGTCVNVGCVPKKLMVYAASFAGEFEDAAGYGWTVGRRQHSWSQLIAHKDTEIERLNGVYLRLLEGAGVTLHDGRARLLDRHRVVVGNETISAERILVATGGWPALPRDVPGAREHAITSNEVFYLKQRPERIVIVGGGYIASEFASIFNGLGSHVTQVYRGNLLLRGFDNDVRECLSQDFARAGIDLRYTTDVKTIVKTSAGLMVTFTDDSMLECDCVMYAIGRYPNTQDLGLAEAGVETAPNGAIPVNADYCTNVPNIYALGDVTNRVNLTPVAIAEGHYLADKLFGTPRPPVFYDSIPTAVFTLPQIGTVGLTEEQARAQGFPEGIDIYRSTFRAMKTSFAGRPDRTLMKLVVDRASDRVLGAHMVGADAAEIIGGLSVAITAGATKAHLDATIGIHPTSSEEFVTMRTPVPEACEFED